MSDAPSPAAPRRGRAAVGKKASKTTSKRAAKQATPQTDATTQVGQDGVEAAAARSKKTAASNRTARAAKAATVSPSDADGAATPALKKATDKQASSASLAKKAAKPAKQATAEADQAPAASAAVKKVSKTAAKKAAASSEPTVKKAAKKASAKKTSAKKTTAKKAAAKQPAAKPLAPATPAARHCPAWLISAPASGQGKTSLTAAIARWHTRQGKRVQVFKTGPDFLDPMLHARAIGAPVQQLDMWMGGETDVRARLYAAAEDADLILIEGVMGLFDGAPSSADLAAQLDVPVLVMLDGGGMAQTFGAVAAGLAGFRKDVQVQALAANRIGSEYHAKLLRESLPDGLAWAGALPRDAALALPERHLGLLPASEIESVDGVLDALADAWGQHVGIEMPAPVRFEHASLPPVPKLLEGVRVAIALDAAFCFLYPANLDVLTQAGAELHFFSPLANEPLPPCDAIWLPGGYPELHGEALSANIALHKALRQHMQAGKPILAECGGLLFSLQGLTDKQGQRWRMAGLLHGQASMQPRLSGLGLQQVQLPEGQLRGHSFHYAKAEIPAEPLAVARNPNDAPTREAVYRFKRLTASFVHFYFPSNPEAACRLLLPG